MKNISMTRDEMRIRLNQRLGLNIETLQEYEDNGLIWNESFSGLMKDIIKQKKYLDLENISKNDIFQIKSGVHCYINPETLREIKNLELEDLEIEME